MRERSKKTRVFFPCLPFLSFCVSTYLQCLLLSMTAFKLNLSSPLFSTWVQCLYLSVCYYKAKKYIQNKLTNSRGEQVDTVMFHELKHFPATLTKIETFPPKQYFPILSLPSPSSFLLLSILTLGHVCVNCVVLKLLLLPYF